MYEERNYNVPVIHVTESKNEYYIGDWIKVVNKKKLKREKSKKEKEKNQKIETLSKIKQKKIEERKKANLWYDENSWQYKVITEKVKFKDGTSITEKYNLGELVKMYSEAKNNYRKNGITGKMLRIITKSEWNDIKDNVEEVVEHSN